MGYCWKCGNKIEDDMTYCPKCGATLKAAPQRQDYGDDKVIRTFGLAVVGVLAAVAILIVALFAVGLLPGMQMPFGTIGSGHATTQPYDLSDFTAISASQGFNVVITQGSSYSVKVTTGRQHTAVRRRTQERQHALRWPQIRLWHLNHPAES